MTDAEFKVVMDGAGLLTRLAAESANDYEGALRELERCDAVGHILDPTKYRDHMADRAAAKKMLRALIEFRSVAREVLDEAREAEGKRAKWRQARGAV